MSIVSISLILKTPKITRQIRACTNKSNTNVVHQNSNGVVGWRLRNPDSNSIIGKLVWTCRSINVAAFIIFLFHVFFQFLIFFSQSWALRRLENLKISELLNFDWSFRYLLNGRKENFIELGLGKEIELLYIFSFAISQYKHLHIISNVLWVALKTKHNHTNWNY